MTEDTKAIERAAGIDKPVSPRCDFCGKTRRQVAHMVTAVDTGACICDQCVWRAVKIIGAQK